MTVSGAILLAAGASRRYGSPKLLAALDENAVVVQQTLSRIATAGLETIVITRPDLETALSALLLEQQQLLVFEQAEQGMGASLAYGATHIPTNWHSCLVCLADMPAIAADTYREIAHHSHQDQITQPCYNGRGGHPVAFGRDFFNELTQLQGDSGAKSVLLKHVDQVRRLQVDDPGILEDIDTPGDLDSLS